MDIAKALATQFSRPLGAGTYINELPDMADSAFVVRLATSPDATDWNGGKQVENFQQFDIYSFDSDSQQAEAYALDARKFLGCLSCLQQAMADAGYSLKQTKTIGGAVSLGKTAENKETFKFTVQITYLATC